MWIVSCLMVLEWNVLLVVMRILYLFCNKKKYILERFVDLFMLLILMIDMMYGWVLWSDVVEGEVIVLIFFKRLSDDVGVSIFVREVFIVFCIFVLIFVLRLVWFDMMGLKDGIIYF